MTNINWKDAAIAQEQTKRLVCGCKVNVITT